MNISPSNQYLVLLVAAVVYLIFLVGWWTVAIGVVVGLCVALYRLYLRRKFAAHEPTPPAVDVDGLTHRIVAANMARRKQQSKTLLDLIESVGVDDPSIGRLVKRLADWHLEYLRDGEIFHHDLYDYLLRNTKERLKSARASYLQQELRYTIDLIRSLMRGVDVVVIVKNLREKLDK